MEALMVSHLSPKVGNLCESKEDYAQFGFENSEFGGDVRPYWTYGLIFPQCGIFERDSHDMFWFDHYHQDSRIQQSEKVVLRYLCFGSIP